MTRHLAVPNGAFLTTSRTRRPSFLYVSYPSAKLQLVRHLECFLELKNNTELGYMDSAAWQPVA